MRFGILHKLRPIYLYPKEDMYFVAVSWSSWKNVKMEWKNNGKTYVRKMESSWDVPSCGQHASAIDSLSRTERRNSFILKKICMNLAYFTQVVQIFHVKGLRDLSLLEEVIRAVCSLVGSFILTWYIV